MLVSQVAELELLDARRLVAGRDRAYFRDAADVRARLSQAGVQQGEAELAVATRFFTIEGMVSYGGAQLRARALVKRDGKRLQPRHEAPVAADHAAHEPLVPVRVEPGHPARPSPLIPVQKYS